MPKRIDEYYADLNKRKGRPLCPFCGTTQVKRKGFFNRNWTCGNESCRMYNRVFPSPSWGSGRR